jgi:hypothetical protein
MTKKISVSEKKKPDEDWMTKKWRPLMAMMYMSCCLADFFLFPIMFTAVQFWETAIANDAFRQWVPITLQGGGLFHVAMGAVLGVTAYGRTQEKLGGVSTPTLSSAVPVQQYSSFDSPTPRTFGGGFNGTSASDFNQQPVSITVGFGGKSAPPSAPQPLI